MKSEFVSILFSWITRSVIVIGSIVVTCSGLFAQDAELPSPQDLQRFGYSFLTGDTAVWAYINDDDMYHLAKAINQRDSLQLNPIKRDDLYFFGLALLKLDKRQLDKLLNDDLYFVGAAMLEQTIAYLQNVKSDELYFLGRALILRNLKELDNIKPKQE